MSKETMPLLRGSAHESEPKRATGHAHDRKNMLGALLIPRVNRMDVLQSMATALDELSFSGCFRITALRTFSGRSLFEISSTVLCSSTALQSQRRMPSTVVQRPSGTYAVFPMTHFLWKERSKVHIPFAQRLVPHLNAALVQPFLDIAVASTERRDRAKERAGGPLSGIHVGGASGRSRQVNLPRPGSGNIASLTVASDRHLYSCGGFMAQRSHKPHPDLLGRVQRPQGESSSTVRAVLIRRSHQPYDIPLACLQ